MTITDAQLHRYARHIILDEVGEEGQEKLLASKVLVVGAGGLGAPLLLYLAGAGVGTLGCVDDDVVELSNLQRQIVHGTESLGELKVQSAAATVARVNPEITFNAIEARLEPGNIAEIIADYDLIADGSDNFATRYLLNDACHFARKPLVSGALMRFDGQLATFRSWEDGAPCYRCIFRDPPPEGFMSRCEEVGIFGAIAGVIGTLQAAEVIKELLGLGTSLSGSLLLYDALETSFRKIRVKKDPACPLCGEAPTITEIA